MVWKSHKEHHLLGRIGYTAVCQHSINSSVHLLVQIFGTRTTRRQSHVNRCHSIPSCYHLPWHSRRLSTAQFHASTSGDASVPWTAAQTRWVRDLIWVDLIDLNRLFHTNFQQLFFFSFLFAENMQWKRCSKSIQRIFWARCVVRNFWRNSAVKNINLAYLDWFHHASPNTPKIADGSTKKSHAMPISGQSSQRKANASHL